MVPSSWIPVSHPIAATGSTAGAETKKQFLRQAACRLAQAAALEH